jgi:hypothetical protein
MHRVGIKPRTPVIKSHVFRDASVALAKLKTNHAGLANAEKCPRTVQARYLVTRLKLRKSLISKGAGGRIGIEELADYSSAAAQRRSDSAAFS